VRRILELWDRLDVRVFGIGGPTWTSAAFGMDTCRRLEQAGAVGELLMAPFDAAGVTSAATSRTGTIAFDVDGWIASGAHRRRRRSGEGPADPRRAPRRRGDDARDRRRDGGGGRPRGRGLGPWT
jgi:hypothetical protein